MLAVGGDLMANRPKFFDTFLTSLQQNAIPVAVIITVLTLLIPVPKMFIDMCMVLNLAIAIIIICNTVVTQLTKDRKGV